MKQSDKLTKLLKKVNAFTALDDATLELLCQKMGLMTYQPGEALCHEGETGDRMFIIESGEVAVCKKSDNNMEIEIAILQSGDIAGEMCLFGQPTRSASLRARNEVQVWTLAYHTYHELLETHSTIAKAMLASLSHHLRRENSILARILSQDTDRRLKVAVFDSKPYIKKVFQECNHNIYNMYYFETRLSYETVALAAGSKVICVFVNDSLDEAVIDELYSLGVELIALRCAGYNNVDLKACKQHGIRVVRVPAYSPHAVAEHAVALMLTLNRRTHRAHNRIREANFSLNGLVGFDFYGKIAGIIGTGKIGQCVLRIMAGFGCQLLAHDPYPDQKIAEECNVDYVSLDELLAQSNIISLHIPLTPETHHLINTAAVGKMKPGVMLINTGRGALIDTCALLDGLKNGKIGYAGLDVYEYEKEYFFDDHSDQILSDDNLARSITFNNVIITSHQAFLTQEALRNIADTTLANIREFEQNDEALPLKNQIVYSGNVG